MKKLFAAFAVLASSLLICACAGEKQEPQPDYDQVRAHAAEAYQEVDNDAE